MQNPQKKKLKCNYCHKEGPTIECCYRKKNKERKESKDHHRNCIAIYVENDLPLCKEMTLLHRTGKDKHDTSLHEQYNMTCDIFVFDSGATSHMQFSKDGIAFKDSYQSWKCR
jgi:3-phosphoglycerate kinase